MNTRALRRMALDIDERHRAGMRDLPERLHELHFGSTARRLDASRRRFLTRAAAGGAVVAVGGVVLPVAGFVPLAGAQAEEEVTLPEADLELATFAASVEHAAVAAYGAAAERRLIEEPYLQLALLFAQHHKDHAGAFEALIAAEEPIAPNATLLEAFAPQIEAATDQTELLTIAFTIEQAAASTYQLAMGVLESADAAAAVATIEPIEAQHAVVWGSALELPIDGDDTDPDNWMPAFESSDQALSPDDYPVA